MNSFYIYFVIFAAACIQVNDSNIQAEKFNLHTKSSDRQEAFKTRLAQNYFIESYMDIIDV